MTSKNIIKQTWRQIFYVTFTLDFDVLEWSKIWYHRFGFLFSYFFFVATWSYIACKLIYGILKVCIPYIYVQSCKNMTLLSNYWFGVKGEINMQNMVILRIPNRFVIICRLILSYSWLLFNVAYLPRITVQEYPSRRVSVRVVSVSPTAIERRSIPVGPLDVEKGDLEMGHVICSWN